MLLFFSWPGGRERGRGCSSGRSYQDSILVTTTVWRGNGFKLEILGILYPQVMSSVSDFDILCSCSSLLLDYTPLFQDLLIFFSNHYWSFTQKKKMLIQVICKIDQAFINRLWANSYSHLNRFHLLKISSLNSQLETNIFTTQSTLLQNFCNLLRHLQKSWFLHEYKATWRQDHVADLLHLHLHRFPLLPTGS